MTGAGGAELPNQGVLDAARAAGARILHVTVKLDEEVMMPAVRAHMVFAALNDHGETLGSIPSPENIEQFQGHVIEAWIASDHPESHVAQTATRVSDVASAEVIEMAPMRLPHGDRSKAAMRLMTSPQRRQRPPRPLPPTVPVVVVTRPLAPSESMPSA